MAVAVLYCTYRYGLRYCLVYGILDTIVKSRASDPIPELRFATSPLHHIRYVYGLLEILPWGKISMDIYADNYHSYYLGYLFVSGSIPARFLHSDTAKPGTF